MTPFAANGGDAIRVWMAEWSFGLEWTSTGLGDYTNRLGKAWLLDQVLQMAEERDIYIILVLLNCADFNNWQTNGWSNNPYNADRGGPLERPEDFATDPEARRLLQRKLNYIVNRWGYSPNLLAWEWWNEVNLTPIGDEALMPWIQEMTGYLRARDVNRHLVTNSYAIEYLSPTWALPELDIIQRHEYSDQVRTNDRDLAARAALDIRALRESAPVKPVLLGEFGYGGEDRGGNIEKTGIHLHNGLWATTFVGYAGSGMYWFWDIYIGAFNQWHHFRPLQRFPTGWT
jgi:endo-1,4-beta-mannosidase